jgi:hypothetical protein
MALSRQASFGTCQTVPIKDARLYNVAWNADFIAAVCFIVFSVDLKRKRDG